MLSTLHEGIRVYGRNDAEPSKDGVRHSTILIDVLSLIEKIERLDSAGKIQGGVVQSNDEREREVFNKLERDVKFCDCGIVCGADKGYNIRLHQNESR